MGLKDIQARYDAIGEDAGGTPAMDIGAGWQAHEDRGELLAEVTRLRGVIATANNALVEVCHGDHEHQIECHADTLPEEHRRVATAAQTALDALSPIVWEMVDPDASGAAPRVCQPIEPIDRAKRLAEIAEREAAAAPGPWGVDGGGDILRLRSGDPEERDACLLFEADPSERFDPANSDFAARAREDVPWLLREIREADAALAALGIPDDGRPLAERVQALWSHGLIARPRSEADREMARAARKEQEEAEERIDRFMAETAPPAKSIKLVREDKVAEMLVAERDKARAEGYDAGYKAGEEHGREGAEAEGRCSRGEHRWVKDCGNNLVSLCADCGVDPSDVEDEEDDADDVLSVIYSTIDAAMRANAEDVVRTFLRSLAHAPVQLALAGLSITAPWVSRMSKERAPLVDAVRTREPERADALLAGLVELDVVTSPEPPPLATGSQPIWPLVIADAEALGCSRLIPDMQARDAFGWAKYGTPLTADNGRNHLADAYQEALDGVVYLRAAMEQGADVGLLYAEAMRVALRIRDAIDGREDPADTAARELGEMPDAEFAERMERAKKMLGEG